MVAENFLTFNILQFGRHNKLLRCMHVHVLTIFTYLMVPPRTLTLDHVFARSQYGNIDTIYDGNKKLNFYSHSTSVVSISLTQPLRSGEVATVIS